MRVLTVQLGPRSYPIYIGPAARTVLQTDLRPALEDRQIVVVADEQVATLHLAGLTGALPRAALLLPVRPGEASKSLAVAGALYDALADAHIERGDVIIAFGGGVTGDVGGFVAATWLRGVRFVQVPTTLEAAVDAAVGGKTALNHRRGKNLIGVFHQPIAVVVDTDFLATLPQRDFLAGLGESVKHALIRDGDFLTWHETYADAIVAGETPVLVDLIARNCEIKAEIVRQDEREEGLRAILNFGHTIGHALEHLLGYELRHGECVALGMRAANELSCRRGLLARETAERVERLLRRLGLPTRLPRRIEPPDVVAACQMDKKVRGGAVNFILLSTPGETLRVADVRAEEIVAAVQAIEP